MQSGGGQVKEKKRWSYRPFAPVTMNTQVLSEGSGGQKYSKYMKLVHPSLGLKPLITGIEV